MSVAEAEGLCVVVVLVADWTLTEEVGKVDAAAGKKLGDVKVGEARASSCWSSLTLNVVGFVVLISTAAAKKMEIENNGFLFSIANGEIVDEFCSKMSNSRDGKKVV